MAGDRPPASRAPQDRLDLVADLHVAKAGPEPAPGMEAAAGGRTIEARDFAGQDDPAASAGAGGWGRRKGARPCTGAPGWHTPPPPCPFDDPAEVHDRDPVCDVPDDGQIVRDEQIGDAELTPQTGQEVDHLCLDRDVERAHWLIANDQIRVDSDRPGDPDPLALHTAELARVSAREAGSRPTSDRSSRTLVGRSRGERARG